MLPSHATSFVHSFPVLLLIWCYHLHSHSESSYNDHFANPDLPSPYSLPYTVSLLFHVIGKSCFSSCHISPSSSLLISSPLSYNFTYIDSWFASFAVTFFPYIFKYGLKTQAFYLVSFESPWKSFSWQDACKNLDGWHCQECLKCL